MKGLVQFLIIFIFFRVLSFGQDSSEINKKSLGGKDFPGYKLVLSDGEMQSEAKVLFIEGTTKGLDPSWDISGYGFDENFRIYTRLIEDNGNDFYVQCLPSGNYSNYSIPVGINFTKGGEVIFKLEVLNGLTEECLAIFEDRKTGVFVDLRKKESKYAVQLSPDSKLSDRFVLHTFDPRNKSLDIKTQAFGNMKIYSCKDDIHIEGEFSGKCSVELFNLAGILVYQTFIEEVNSAVIHTNLENGIYLCRLIHKSTPCVVKLYLK